MACQQHPKFAGRRLGKNAKNCPGCVAFAAEVLAAKGKETRVRVKKTLADIVDEAQKPEPVVAPEGEAPLGDVFSDPVEDEEEDEEEDEDGFKFNDDISEDV